MQQHQPFIACHILMLLQLVLLLLVIDVSQTADIQFESEMLKAHNEYRKKHDSPPMSLSIDVSKTAQTWAAYLASNEELKHSTASQRNKAGENLFEKTGTTDGKEPVEEWYNEIKHYDFGSSSGFADKTGRFTQLIWKNSTTLGVGMATSKSGKVYVVAHYVPVGNIVGHFEKNVLPAVNVEKKSKSD